MLGLFCKAFFVFNKEIRVFLVGSLVEYYALLLQSTQRHMHSMKTLKMSLLIKGYFIAFNGLPFLKSMRILQFQCYIFKFIELTRLWISYRLNCRNIYLTPVPAKNFKVPVLIILAFVYKTQSSNCIGQNHIDPFHRNQSFENNSDVVLILINQMLLYSLSF